MCAGGMGSRGDDPWGCVLKRPRHPVWEMVIWVVWCCVTLQRLVCRRALSIQFQVHRSVRDVVLQFLYFDLIVLRQVMCGHYATYDYRNVNDIKGNTDLVDEIVLQNVSHTN
jgi:hypothetical protein